MNFLTLIFLFSLFFLSTFGTSINAEDDDDESLADISNLAVHLVGGFIFLLGITTLAALISIYVKIGFKNMPPEVIESVIDQVKSNKFRPLKTEYR
jgi:hypothetical protein